MFLILLVLLLFNDNYQGEIDFSNSSFKLTMDAELVDNHGGTSSDYIDIYDFLNDKVRNQSKAITNNNNPYVPIDSDNPIQNNAQVPTVQTGDGVVPTGNNSVSSSGSGTVNVVQNNNNGLINPKPVTDMVKMSYYLMRMILILSVCLPNRLMRMVLFLL